MAPGDKVTNSSCESSTAVLGQGPVEMSVAPGDKVTNSSCEMVLPDGAATCEKAVCCKRGGEDFVAVELVAISWPGETVT